MAFGGRQPESTAPTDRVLAWYCDLVKVFRIASTGELGSTKQPTLLQREG